MAGTLQPMTLTFGNIIDRNSLLSFLHVTSENGEKIAGKMTIGKDERAWSFTPNKKWNAKPYAVIVDPRLEDHAGNTPVRPFDLDLRAPKRTPQNLRIPFTPSNGRQPASRRR